jgi:hypothetical protein
MLDCRVAISMAWWTVGGLIMYRRDVVERLRVIRHEQVQVRLRFDDLMRDIGGAEAYTISDLTQKIGGSMGDSVDTLLALEHRIIP